jgi:hypothetical protein
MSAVRELAYRPSVPDGPLGTLLMPCLRTYNLSLFLLEPYTNTPLQAMPLAPYSLICTAMYLSITKSFPFF